ncbi:MAG: hypothetical protein AAF723_01920 [Pseudomonadota bacterium]
MKQSKKNHLRLFMGAAGIALSCTTAAASEPHDHASPPTMVEAVAPVQDVSPSSSPEDSLLPEGKDRFVFGVALATLVGGILGFFGVNRLAKVTQKIAQKGTAQVVKAAAVTTKIPLQAAKGVVRATGKAFKKPIQLILSLFSVGLFLLMGISFLDIQWQVGLGVGAAISLFLTGQFRGLKSRFNAKKREMTTSS